LYKLILIFVSLLVVACGREEPAPEPAAPPPGTAAGLEAPDFKVIADRFADVQVLRYQVPGFEELSLGEKKLAYYLSEAALAGRDIIWDQNYRHNLRIRKVLAAVVETYSGDRSGADYAAFLEYAKRVWFSNGIHHHYSNDKFVPGFTRDDFARLLRGSDRTRLPLDDGQEVDGLIATLTPVLFDPEIAAKKVNLDPDVDQVVNSAVNFYRDVSQAEVEAFYAGRVDPMDPRPISWGLNSQLARVDGELVERVWKSGGMYGAAIDRIVHWLEQAGTVAESAGQKAWLDALVRYYRSGELADFDTYSIAWVEDTDSRIDTINGFIEVYNDPLGYRGSYEGVVSLRDMEATKRIAMLGANAQWFEDQSPILPEHRKENVVGISAKVITVISEAGDSAPSTPIGINLPNANWIRQEHGSKSVTLGNIIDAYNAASDASGLHEEFMLTEEEAARHAEHGSLSYVLDVDLHEVIGHASGKLNPGVGTPKETLKSYASTLEEARADLVSLYYITDPKLVELGLVPSDEVGKAAYDSNIRNGLMLQLRRIEPGDNIEEAHMRNRQLIAGWAYEKGLENGVIERVEKDGKSYFVIRDYEGLRTLFGDLLREIQRIKSEGDYEAARNLVETYGVKVDQALHREVLERVAPLDIAAYSGFIQPRLVPVTEGGEIVDIRIEYPDDFVAQMLEYERRYSYLPVVN